MIEQQGFSPAWQPAESLPLQRSDLGLASFVQSLVFAAMVILSLTIAVVAVAGHGGKLDAESHIAILLGLFFIGGMGVGLSGLGLGIASLFQKGKQRTWAILGILLNGMGLFVMAALVVVSCLAH